MPKDLTNFLDETVEALTKADKSADDVAWCGSRDGTLVCSFADFAEKAKAINYDAGYGGQGIPSDLVVVGGDWWLERHEYDGSGRWAYKQLPTIADGHRPVTKIISDDNDYGYQLSQIESGKCPDTVN